LLHRADVIATDADVLHSIKCANVLETLEPCSPADRFIVELLDAARRASPGAQIHEVIERRFFATIRVIFAPAFDLPAEIRRTRMALPAGNFLKRTDRRICLPGGDQTFVVK
jgi:hypothetical protein